jgi:GT2 family glycosyltransferase
MEANPDVGIIGPQMLGSDGMIRRSTMRFPTLTNTVLRTVGLDRSPGLSRLSGGQLMADFKHDCVRDVDVLNGWFWMIRREALDQVGGLDERFFIYGEDVDWCRRFRQKGWRVVFYPGAKAIHYGGASSSVASERFYVEMQRADLQYWRKHHSRMSYCVYYGLSCLHHLFRVVGHLCAGLRGSARRRDNNHAKANRSAAALAFLLKRAVWQ